ncbi:MAG: hypothetical protein IT432_11595 [Phycisphaerales bacterium]|nr:hypothetical protein [Phycisphaerales bacterium]
MDTRRTRRYRFELSDIFTKAVLQRMAASDVGISVVARKAGIHRNVLARWLDGSGTIRLDQFVRVAAALRLRLRVD